MEITHFLKLQLDYPEESYSKLTKQVLARTQSSTSFPGSFILGKKDPGSGWSRTSLKVGGDKKTAGGRSKQVAILAFLYSL